MRVLPLLVLLAGCFGAPPSPFARIAVEKTGRVYYAHMGRALHSPTGGFLTFTDLITREQVRLKNGTYLALECTRQEVSVRQREYLETGKKPQISDYEPEK